MARVCLGNIMGPPGPAGEAGAPGVAGPKGEAGHTPVKGTDYFTEEDILAMLESFAPAGYGLGAEETKQHITWDSINTIFKSGLYWVNCPNKKAGNDLFNYGMLRVTAMGTTHCIQEFFPLGMDYVLVRRCYENTWPTGWGKITWSNTVYVGD